MHQEAWTQVNIAYPGHTPEQREQQAVKHLADVMLTAEVSGLISSWFFIRKGRWRVRYMLAESDGHGGADPLHARLTAGVAWTSDVYEPEVHAFGGPGSMNTAHTLFHHDSRHLLSLLPHTPVDRQERSLVLCTALMRAAGLDVNEQGDVWARIAEQRSSLAEEPPSARAWASFTGGVRRLLLGEARTDLIGGEWLTAFEEAGRELRNLRERGELSRGLRQILSLHVIFHWNRIGVPGAAQAMLTRAAKEAIFGNAET
ncbi:thiopeptide-type bacteriocin biosynthesis protein [Actinomadura atramentaria]|uniref:thiopeptide-type bacteriocin biosynthesis protein n=1 Tax=Actinomadura atramentaria TaxID=1990 RepID=UPI00037AE094|nr:thiopeptide-type bacteriocin biosynthesis protein [Actinomadura atramentaria]